MDFAAWCGKTLQAKEGKHFIKVIIRLGKFVWTTLWNVSDDVKARAPQYVGRIRPPTSQFRSFVRDGWRLYQPAAGL